MEKNFENATNFAKTFSDFVNDYCADLNTAADKMSKEHRYLQTKMFQLCAMYIKKLADNYEKKHFDARNEIACKTANEICQNVEYFKYLN